MKKIGVSYKLQPSSLEQEKDHDKIYEDNWEEKEDDWLPYLENDLYQQLSVMLVIVNAWKN